MKAEKWAFLEEVAFAPYLYVLDIRREHKSWFWYAEIIVWGSLEKLLQRSVAVEFLGASACLHRHATLLGTLWVSVESIFKLNLFAIRNFYYSNEILPHWYRCHGLKTKLFENSLACAVSTLLASIGEVFGSIIYIMKLIEKFYLMQRYKVSKISPLALVLGSTRIHSLNDSRYVSEHNRMHQSY